MAGPVLPPALNNGARLECFIKGPLSQSRQHVKTKYRSKRASGHCNVDFACRLSKEEKKSLLPGLQPPQRAWRSGSKLTDRLTWNSSPALSRAPQLAHSPRDPPDSHCLSGGRDRSIDGSRTSHTSQSQTNSGADLRPSGKVPKQTTSERQT